MRFSINIPNFGDFADPEAVATVAVAAEQAGWNGLFVWDHVVHNKQTRRGQPFGGLELLARYWSGEPVTHDGRHYQVQDVTLLPATVQRPRPPIWIGGFWPHRAPMRRAARWDGAVPLFTDARHGHVPPVDQVRDLVAYVNQHREDRQGRPFEIVLGGATPGDPAKARDVIAPLVEAGATWWDERQLQATDDVHRLTPVLRRINHGPPAL
jgi:alkanesulfonate monooxygenase SsuD/methylene tetrahydromethanopterin reductase-like flavin-dependent oxidoreductase (luciferase family)